MSESTYLLAVKESARRVSGLAGTWVNEHGPRRGFESEALAREWARRCRGHDASVWVQNAPPSDASPVDGYLVGCKRRHRTPAATHAEDRPRQADLTGF